MVPLVGNICTNLIANGTIGKEIGANGNTNGTIGRTQNTRYIFSMKLATLFFDKTLCNPLSYNRQTKSVKAILNCSCKTHIL